MGRSPRIARHAVWLGWLDHLNTHSLEISIIDKLFPHPWSDHVQPILDGFVTGRDRLEVEQGSSRDDFGRKLGAGDAAPLHCDLHRVVNDGKLASRSDGGLQAIGERMSPSLSRPSHRWTVPRKLPIVKRVGRR